MNAIDLGFFGATVKKAVTSSAGSFTPGDADYKTHRYMIVSDAACNIARNETATASTVLLPANTPVQIAMYGNDTLSYITATTANLYITELTGF